MLLRLAMGGVVASGGSAGPGEGQELLTAADVMVLPSPAPDLVIPYGEAPQQFGHLRLPPGEGPHPVVVFFHGGCWLAEYGIGHVGALEAALAEQGYAVWSLEYRRVGDPGGGWPGTFQDAAQGADHLRVLARRYPLDLAQVVAAGHSAGGHLALWLASRRALPETSELFRPEPLEVHGVLGLAPAADLEGLHRAGTCGNAVDRLMGGSPSGRPERYAHGSPMGLAPLSLPVWLVVGEYDETWTPAGRAYHRRALDRGAPDARLLVAPGSGHFEMIVPTTPAGRLVLNALADLFLRFREIRSAGGQPANSAPPA